MVKTSSKKSKIIVEKIVEKPKEVVEHIKEDAKDYYKGKNMVSRYIILGFLVILLVLQFLLPRNKTNDISTLSNTGDTLESSSPKTPTDYNLLFLDQNVDVHNQAFDQALTDIISDLPALRLLYKKSLSTLPILQKRLQEENIPTDMQYLVLLNGLDDPIWMLPYEAIDQYDLQIDDEVDESYNFDKATDVSIEYLRDLYQELGDRRLAMLGYLIGGDELKAIMDEQNQDKFDKLYLEPYVMGRYYNVIAYKYVFEHISDYIDVSQISPYPSPSTQIISVGKVDNLVKRAVKHNYTYKEIKELNPWILYNSLPKGKWKIKVYSE